MEGIHVRCGACKRMKLPEVFLNAKNRILKTCISCRDLAKLRRERNKCGHGRRKTQCKECGGNSICEHDRCRSQCKECKPAIHLRHITRSRIHSALKGTGVSTSVALLGCSVEEFKAHITEQLRDGMSWDNYGRWEIDHILPLEYGMPVLEETLLRLHYTNTQPMWAAENGAKNVAGMSDIT